MLCNFIEIALQHGCSPVNLLRISRTPFPKNTSEGLLLDKVIHSNEGEESEKTEKLSIDISKEEELLETVRGFPVLYVMMKHIKHSKKKML